MSCLRKDIEVPPLAKEASISGSTTASQVRSRDDLIAIRRGER